MTATLAPKGPGPQDPIVKLAGWTFWVNRYLKNLPSEKLFQIFFREEGRGGNPISPNSHPQNDSIVFAKIRMNIKCLKIAVDVRFSA